MRRIKVIGLVATLLVFGMMSLGSGSSSASEKKEIVADSSSTAADDAADTQEAAASNEEETADSADSSEAVTIEEQVLFEQDGLKVTATEYVVDSIWGDGIKLLIENDSASDIGLGCNARIVNDYMITDLFSATVAAGKKDYETLNLSSSGLKAAGIDNVGKIEIYFHTFDPDTYMTIADMDCVTIQTSAFDSMDSTQK